MAKMSAAREAKSAERRKTGSQECAASDTSRAVSGCPRTPARVAIEFESANESDAAPRGATSECDAKWPALQAAEAAVASEISLRAQHTHSTAHSTQHRQAN